MRTAWVVVALPLLAASTIDRPQSEPPAKKFRLDLHVPDQGGIYFSAWDGDPVISDHDASDGRTVTYRRRYVWDDRCTWEATETLVPKARDRYDYSYRERPVSCPAGATAETFATTPRDGSVTVHPTDLAKPLTPLVAWARGWEHAR
ncbi:MAG TPA: hypothetical protein VGG74_34555 [Kofleriaceae bacterium]|jgi:hypothetical protein